MLQYLIVIAESWPIAVMVIGVAVCIVVRRSIRQRLAITERTTALHRSDKAVVVHEHA